MLRLFPPSFRERDPPFLWKIILRGLSILLAIVSIGTLAWAFTNRVGRSSGDDDSDADSYGEDSYYFGDGLIWSLPWSFISLGLSVTWNFANLLTIWVRDGRGIHPGANVGCDLFLWLVLLVTGIFATFGATDLLFRYDGSYYSGDDNRGPSQDFYNFLNRKGIVIAVGAAIQYVLLLFHFALFISACRYTHARRHPGSRYDAKAITEEATVIARKMIADMTGPGGGFIFVNGKGEHLVAHPAEQQHLLGSQDARSIQPAMEESIERRTHQQQFPPSSVLGKGKEPAYSPPTAFESVDSSSAGPTRSGPS